MVKVKKKIKRWNIWCWMMVRFWIPLKPIYEGVVQFFQNLLIVSRVEDELALELLAPSVSMQENEMLCAMPPIEEVKVALWSIPTDSSPDPDGFSASFFILAWDIVKEYLLEWAKYIFEGQPISTYFGATNLVLIPKVDEPVGFGQFQPISLFSVVYKIVAKIMVFSLVLILDRIISHEQATFITGRSIFDNMSLAQELVHGINRKVRGGNVMLKIDMAKAYDQVNW